jgi:hypothetical protein
MILRDGCSIGALLTALGERVQTSLTKGAQAPRWGGASVHQCHPAIETARTSQSVALGYLQDQDDRKAGGNLPYSYTTLSTIILPIMISLP